MGDQLLIAGDLVSSDPPTVSHCSENASRLYVVLHQANTYLSLNKAVPPHGPIMMSEVWTVYDMSWRLWFYMAVLHLLLLVRQSLECR